jgi:hypothetical protein
MPHKLLVALDHLHRLLLLSLHGHCSVGLPCLYCQWNKVFVANIRSDEVHSARFDFDEVLRGVKGLAQEQEVPQNSEHDEVEDIDFQKTYLSVIAGLYPS